MTRWCVVRTLDDIRSGFLAIDFPLPLYFLLSLSLPSTLPPGAARRGCRFRLCCLRRRNLISSNVHIVKLSQRPPPTPLRLCRSQQLGP